MESGSPAGLYSDPARGGRATGFHVLPDRLRAAHGVLQDQQDIRLDRRRYCELYACLRFSLFSCDSRVCFNSRMAGSADFGFLMLVEQDFLKVNFL